MFYNTDPMNGNFNSKHNLEIFKNQKLYYKYPQKLDKIKNIYMASNQNFLLNRTPQSRNFDLKCNFEIKKTKIKFKNTISVPKNHIYNKASNLKVLSNWFPKK